MTRLVKWGAMRINRRRALAAAGTGVFGAFASMAIGAPAHAGSCTGPYGSGNCGSALCSGSNCRNSAPYRCHKVTGYCRNPSSACWTSGSHTCCDCKCYEGSYVWYCYCHG